MDIPIFTPCLVYEELSTLDTSKSPNPDQLHPKLLNWLDTYNAEPLQNWFYNYLETVDVPDDWTAAVLCPIFRKVNPDDVANYRPVSPTSIVFKAFERILNRIILSFLSMCSATKKR